MTHRTIDAANWIFRQPKTVQEAGEASGEALIREVTLQESGTTETLHETIVQDETSVPNGE